jgi:hypothetical protein
MGESAQKRAALTVDACAALEEAVSILQCNKMRRVNPHKTRTGKKS